MDARKICGSIGGSMIVMAYAMEYVRRFDGKGDMVDLKIVYL